MASGQDRLREADRAWQFEAAYGRDSGREMYRDPTFRQKGLKGELAHLRQTARLGEGQPLLLEQRQRKFLL